MDIQLPDGTVLKGVPDGTTKEQISAKLKASGRTDPWLDAAEKPTQPAQTYGQKYVAGVSDTAGSVAQEFRQHPFKSAALTIPAVAETIAQGVGMGVADLSAVAHRAIDSSETFAQRKQEYEQGIGKYTNAQTDLGKKFSEAAGAALKPVGDVISVPGKLAGSAAGEFGASPETQKSIEEQTNAVTGGLLMRAGAKTPAPVSAVAPKAPSLVTRAIQSGYTLKPSEAGGKVGKVAEGLSGSPKLEVEASVKNQKITNKLAAQELGINGPITKASLEQAKKAPSAFYKTVADRLKTFSPDQTYVNDVAGLTGTKGLSLGAKKEIANLQKQYTGQNMTAADAIAETRQLRAMSSKMLRGPYNPDLEARALAMRKISDAIESNMERQAKASGDPYLLDQFKSARRQLAKIHSVESSMVGPDVSAKLLAKQANRGAPLSGNLKHIAEVADEFPNVTRDASKLKNKVPVTVLEGVAAGGGALALGPQAAALLAVRPATRAVLKSRAYQKKLIPKDERKPSPNTLSSLRKFGPAGSIALQDAEERP